MKVIRALACLCPPHRDTTSPEYFGKLQTRNPKQSRRLALGWLHESIGLLPLSRRSHVNRRAQSANQEKEAPIAQHPNMPLLGSVKPVDKKDSPMQLSHRFQVSVDDILPQMHCMCGKIAQRLAVSWDPLAISFCISTHPAKNKCHFVKHSLVTSFREGFSWWRTPLSPCGRSKPFFDNTCHPTGSRLGPSMFSRFMGVKSRTLVQSSFVAKSSQFPARARTGDPTFLQPTAVSALLGTTKPTLMLLCVSLQHPFWVESEGSDTSSSLGTYRT